MVKSPLLLPKRRATNATPALAFDLTAQPSAAQSGGGNNGAQRLQAARASTAWKRLQSMAILSGNDIQNPSVGVERHGGGPRATHTPRASRTSKGMKMTKSYMLTPAVHILTRSDLSDIELAPADVIRLVESAYSFYANGESCCPTKLMMPLPDEQRDAVSYAMLGYDGALQQLGFKTSYRQGNDSAEKYYTTISLYDDTTGLPFAFMDCHRVGGSRTPATTAIIAKHCAMENPTSALMIGTGAQGINTLPYLLTALPSLRTLRLFGTHPAGIAASLATFARHFPDREVELVENVPDAVADSDIVVAASGRAAHPKVQTQWMKPGGLLISVASKGVEAGSLTQADYAVATNEGQMGVTGKRLAGPDGIVTIDAELPDIVAGRKLGRRSQSDRVFAFSSGMIITDIPVAHALAIRAIAAGRGKRIELWK